VILGFQFQASKMNRGSRSRGSHNVPRRGKFQPAYETFGPMRNADLQHIKYKPPALRMRSRDNLASQKGSAANLHCDDTLRRVSVVLHRHILLCERRKLLYSSPDSYSYSRELASPSRPSVDGDNDTSQCDDTPPSISSPRCPGTSGTSGNQGNGSLENNRYRGALGMDISELGNGSEMLNEDLFIKSQYKYAFLRLPRLPLWTPYRMEKVVRTAEVPSVEQIYSFIRHL